ncbi:hypothetical protein CB291_02020 [Salmonella enterica subsp. enterica serovar Pomona]|nr:hypothetical protein [Salmonella enterica subsp. enterica serovar Pomona]
MRKYALRISLYYGDTLTRTLYDSKVFICQNAASEREARLQLPAVRLVFAARIRVQEDNKPCLNSLSVW